MEQDSLIIQCDGKPTITFNKNRLIFLPSKNGGFNVINYHPYYRSLTCIAKPIKLEDVVSTDLLYACNQTQEDYGYLFEDKLWVTSNKGEIISYPITIYTELYKMYDKSKLKHENNF